MYYNARYYDPALGTFISPDSIIPDPGMVIDYNRFLYVRGNPFKYTDPSGRDLVCVKGGPPAFNSDKDYFIYWCYEVARRIGWNEEINGPIRFINNAPTDTDAVVDLIKESKAADSSRPIVFLGHSWGAIGSLDAAVKLKPAGIPVDAFVGVDTEDFARWQHTTPAGHIKLSDNIKVGVGIFAEEIGTEYDDSWRWDDGVDVMLNHDGTPALNIPIDEVETSRGREEANHFNIAEAENTIGLAAWLLYGTLGMYYRNFHQPPVPFGGGPVQDPIQNKPPHQFI